MKAVPNEVQEKGILFIVSAPSGAGKTTLCREVSMLVPNLKYSISYTTRMQRPGETNRKDYIFVTRDEFKDMIERGEFAEWAKVHGHLYGSSIKDLNDLRKRSDVILDIDTQGARAIRQLIDNSSGPLAGSKGVFIFILPPSIEILEERIRKRMTDSEIEIKGRIEKAREEIAGYKEYEYVIINNNFSEALSELKSIILSERCRRERIDLGFVEKLVKT